MGADEETALTLAQQALQNSKNTGFLQDYLFLVRGNPMGGQTVLMLNCETKLASVRTLALFSGLACLGGILLAFVLVSHRADHPEHGAAETVHHQRQP